MHFMLKLADLIIEVHPHYRQVQEFCKDYLVTHGEPQIRIFISQQDIALEKEQAAQETRFSNWEFETIAVLRKIAAKLPQQERFLCHGAAITWKNKGFLFTAPSGTGKSTHISLWRKYLGSDVEIVNGDKPVLAVEKDEQGQSAVRVYGTPWAGKEQWQKNRSARLDGICILKQAKENRIYPLQIGEALPLLIRQIYFTSDEETAGRIMELMNQMLLCVPIYLLLCDMSKEAVQCSFEYLTKEQFEENRC